MNMASLLASIAALYGASASCVIAPMHCVTPLRRLLPAMFVSLFGLSHTPVAIAQECPAGWATLTEQGLLGTNDVVFALAVLPDGDVIVGGTFTTAGGVVANNIARYNPATNGWSALASGTNNTVRALAVLPDGDVIAGGSFTSAGGAPANNIARYHPATNTWSALGSGVGSTSGYQFVNALAVLAGGDVIAGGLFATAGGVAANNIARYNPGANVWSALGSGTDIDIFALAVLPGGDVIAGGWFTTAGGFAARSVARFNPSINAWSALGAGLNTVWALCALPNGEAIAGGYLVNPSGIIARYNQAANNWWVTGGVEYVYALAVLPDGDVIAGGDFSITVGGVAANNIARYNPATNTWSRMGSGMNGPVRALAVLPNGNVIAGGDFTTAGGNVSARFAHYAFGTTPPSISIQPVNATTCPAGSADFHVSVSGGNALSYHWQIQTSPGVWQTLGTEPAPFPCGGTAHATPLNAPNVAIGIAPCPANMGQTQQFQVRCIVSNACGSATSNEATYTISCQNKADVARLGGEPACDGQITVDDIVYYLDQFFSNNVTVADLTNLGGTGNPDGEITADDLICFLSAFFTACP